jgi:hypothetical protein
MAFTQHDFWIKFFKKLPASFPTGDVVLHALAVLAAEAARRLAVLPEEFFSLVCSEWEDTGSNRVYEDVYACVLTRTSRCCSTHRIFVFVVRVVLPVVFLCEGSWRPYLFQADFLGDYERVASESIYSFDIASA